MAGAVGRLPSRQGSLLISRNMESGQQCKGSRGFVADEKVFSFGGIPIIKELTTKCLGAQWSVIGLGVRNFQVSSKYDG